jgi:hypothetical protein
VHLTQRRMQARAHTNTPRTHTHTDMHAQTEDGSYQQTDEEPCEHSLIFTRFDANAKFSANTILIQCPTFSFSAQRRVDLRHMKPVPLRIDVITSQVSNFAAGTSS